MFTRYICFCFERKITPEEMEEIKKERVRILAPLYRPGIVKNY